MDAINTHTAMSDETMYSGIQNLSLQAEISHFKQGDLCNQATFPVESLYERSITSYDQASTSTQFAPSTELPVHQRTSFNVSKQLLAKTGSRSSNVCSADSLARKETLENRTDCIRKPRPHCSTKSEDATPWNHKITIHTANGPVTFKSSQKLTDSSKISSVSESILLQLYEERDRLLRNSELPKKLMMFQEALKLRKKSNFVLKQPSNSS